MQMAYKQHVEKQSMLHTSWYKSVQQQWQVLSQPTGQSFQPQFPVLEALELVWVPVLLEKK